MPPDVHALLLVHPQLWMTTMWIIASGTTGESSGASAIAKNAIGSSPRGRPELDVSQTAALNRLLSRSVKTTCRERSGWNGP
ncbi:hypothetical protein F5887DRAFT_561972 [Amanita rubescens]|nr:hypothetical protein F5887DRAFT_561972 [Amanita rubescens]